MTDYLKAYRDPTNVYHLEARRVAAQFSTDATVTDGVVRWNSNGRVPPIEILDLWSDLGLEFAYLTSANARDSEEMAFLADYRARYTGPSDEEKRAARAAFGPGLNIVNVITGTEWTT